MTTDRYGPRGQEFYDSVTTRYELTDGEHEILGETCSTLDMLDALAAEIVTSGPMTVGASGQPVVHPALAEARLQRLTMHRLLAALGLRDADEQTTVRSAQSIRGTIAARARWSAQARTDRTG